MKIDKKHCILCKKELTPNNYVKVLTYLGDTYPQCMLCFNKYIEEEAKEILASGLSTKEWEKRIYKYFDSNVICDLLDLAIIKYGNEYFKKLNLESIANISNNNVMIDIKKLIDKHTTLTKAFIYQCYQVVQRIHTWYEFYFKPKFYEKLGA